MLVRSVIYRGCSRKEPGGGSYNYDEVDVGRLIRTKEVVEKVIHVGGGLIGR